MDNKLFRDILEKLDQASSIDDLHRICSVFCEENQFDNFIYGARIPTSLIKPYFVFISSYPDEWRTEYVNRGYIRTDPTVIHCAKNTTPVDWNSIDKSNKIMVEAKDYSLLSGVSVPLHTANGEFAMMSIASSEPYQKTKEKIFVATPYTQLLITYLHERVKKVIRLGQIEEQIKLTKREQECLLWTAEGKTSWEVSQILNISERTIIFHLQNASVKLGVANRQQAIAKAIVKGLISPQMISA